MHKRKCTLYDPLLRDPFYFATDSPPLPAPRRLDVLWDSEEDELFPLNAFHRIGTKKLQARIKLAEVKLAEDGSLNEETRLAPKVPRKAESQTLKKTERAYLTKKYRFKVSADFFQSE